MTNRADITTPIVDRLSQLVDDVPGWTPLDQLYTLFTLASCCSDLDGDIVEIGSWCGRSSVVLGYAAQLQGGTMVHCIDLFPHRDDWKQNADGSYSFSVEISGIRVGGYQDQTVWAEPFERDIAPIYSEHESVYEVFQSNVSRCALSDVIQPHRGTSDLLGGLPNFRCKLAFLDGDHSYPAVCRDIENVERHLLPGGWICFDDAFSCYDGVDKAITERIIESGKYELCQQMTRKFFIARRRRD